MAGRDIRVPMQLTFIDAVRGIDRTVAFRQALRELYEQQRCEVVAENAAQQARFDSLATTAAVKTVEKMFSVRLEFF